MNELKPEQITLSNPDLQNGETVELTKNTRGYNWSIKLRCQGNEKLDNKTIKRLEELNNLMVNTFETSIYNKGAE